MFAANRHLSAFHGFCYSLVSTCYFLLPPCSLLHAHCLHNKCSCIYSLTSFYTYFLLMFFRFCSQLFFFVLPFVVLHLIYSTAAMFLLVVKYLQDSLPYRILLCCFLPFCRCCCCCCLLCFHLLCHTASFCLLPLRCFHFIGNFHLLVWRAISS